MSVYDDWAAFVDVRRRRHRRHRRRSSRPTSAARCPRRGRCSPSGSTTAATPRSRAWPCPTVPATFTKFPASLAGPFDDIEIVGDDRRLGGRARRGHRHAAPTASPRPTRGRTSPGSPSARTSATARCSSPPARSSRSASRAAATARWARGSSRSTRSPTPTTSRSAARSTARRCRTPARATSSSACRASSPSCRRCCRCCPATSSSPARRPASASPASRRGSSQPGQVLEIVDRGHRHDPQPVRLMGALRATPSGPHAPGPTTYVAARASTSSSFDTGEVELNYVTARSTGDDDQARAAADPRPDRVVVGLRSGAAAARRALPGLRRRPARPGPVDPHAGPLHARQHRQRPRPLHRRRHRPADDRRRAVVGRRHARRGCRPTPGPGRSSAPYYEDPPLFPSEVRPAVGQGIGQASDRSSPSWPSTSATSGAIGDWDGDGRGRSRRAARLARRCIAGALGARRRAAAEPQGVRPRVGPRLLDRHASAPRATTSGCSASVKVPVLFTHHFRMIDEATGALLGASPTSRSSVGHGARHDAGTRSST